MKEKGSNTIYPNPDIDIDNIPTNATGTFIKNITVRCSFCTQRFNRPDEYKLHHGEKHAKIYGILPDQVTNSAQEDNTINASAENSTTLKFINNAALIRKRRPSCAPSVSYVDDDINSSSDSGTSGDDDVDDKSPENSWPEPGTSSNDFLEKPNDRERTESIKTRKKLLKKSKERDSSSSSDSSLNKFLLKFSKKLMKHLKNKMFKDKINQKNILYKCNKCSLHFLKRRKFFKHLKRGKHTELQQTQCEHCMLQFSKRSIRKHVKMHMTNERIDKNKRFKILTENDCCFDDSSNSSISEHSGSDDDDQIGVPLSEPESLNKPVEENQDQMLTRRNVKNTSIKNHASVSAKRKISEIQPKNVDKKQKLINEPVDRALLYRCEGCKLSIASRTTLSRHIRICEGKSSRKYLCKKCQLYFITKYTLARHVKVHKKYPHLKKEDFKVISRPIIQKNTSVPQSNIVSTTEGNHNDSVMEQDHSKSITNNQNSLDLAETNVGNISKQNMVVKSAYFQKPVVELKVELNADGIIFINDKNEYSKNNEHSDANSSRVIYQNKNDQNEIEKPLTIVIRDSDDEEEEEEMNDEV